MTRATTATAIRDACAGDAAAVSTLLGELGYPSTAEVIAQRLAAVQAAASERVLVAVRGGAVRGVLSLHVTTMLHQAHPVGRLTALVVSQDERAAGIGRALVDAGEQWLAAQGCELVEVTSNVQRLGAHAFYRRLGYASSSLRFRKPLFP